MLTKVRVYNEAGAYLEIPILSGTVANAKYQVKDITGLEPVKASIASSPLANMDGIQINAATTEGRNIVLQLGFTPNYSAGDTIATLRRALSTYVAPKANVVLHFFSDDGFPTVKIAGKIEDLYAPLFQKNPFIQISVLCPDPYFYELTNNVVSGALNASKNIVYAGDVPNGFLFELTANTDMNSFTINKGDLFMLFQGVVSNTNKVQINTVKGQKLVRQNGFLPLPANWRLRFKQFYMYSDWLELSKGNNLLTFVADPVNNSPYTITYTNRYSGL